MFPFSEKIEIKPRVLVPAQEVARLTRPFLTDERVKKIEKVVSQRAKSVTVVMEDIYDRGNASAVMRSAEAMGFLSCHMIESGEKFKSANRVTQGADKWLHIQRWSNTLSCVQHLKNVGYRICVTSLEATHSIDDVDFTIPTAIVLGNEKDGISQTMKEMADLKIIIPMQGFVQSYNISVAGALSLYHIFQDRKHRQGQNCDLTESEKQTLMAHYYMRSLESAPDKLMALLEREGRLRDYEV